MTVSEGIVTGEIARYVGELRTLSIESLARMYVPDEKRFVFCIRRGPNGDVPEGRSFRYAAIVLIGLATESDDVVQEVLHGASADDVCSAMINELSQVTNLGDVALTLWAAKLLNHDGVEDAFARLRELDPVYGAHPTVELAWTLTGLSVDTSCGWDEPLAGEVYRRLRQTYNRTTGIPGHWPEGVAVPAYRAHVSCFADLVYPTQAWAYYHRATGDEESRALCKECAQFMCDRQGPAGQWWWHFDKRSGKVVEGYPVYSVHQDSMAPMALYAAEDLCGSQHGDSIELGLRWLQHSPEIDGTLVDHDAGLIWRKVARREPGKLSRGVQALASKAHPAFRMPGMKTVFPPVKIDFESRPYHMGWVLHAFPERRLQG